MGGQIRCGRIWRFWGARFSVQRSQNPLKIDISGPLDWKLGRPKNAKFNHDGSDPPFAALWGKVENLQESAKIRENLRWARPLLGSSPSTAAWTTARSANVYVNFFFAWRTDLDWANGRGGFGSQTATDPLWWPPQSPWKADRGYCDTISQNSNPASTLELSHCWHCTEGLPGPRRGFWVPSGSLSPKTAASICTLWKGSSHHPIPLVPKDWKNSRSPSRIEISKRHVGYVYSTQALFALRGTLGYSPPSWACLALRSLSLYLTWYIHYVATYHGSAWPWGSMAWHFADSTFKPQTRRMSVVLVSPVEWNFPARLKISSEPPTKPLFFFMGNSEGRDWKFQSRLKFPSEIENFKRDWIFQSLGP